MRLATNPKQLPTTTPTLPSRLRELQRGRDRLLAGLAAAHDFEQLHHVRRAEEVMAEHLRRPPARAARTASMSSVDEFDASMQSGRVTAPSSANVAFFSSMFSNTASTTMSTLVEAVVAGRRRDQRHRRLDLRLGVILPFDTVDVVVLADGRQAAIERRLVDVLQQHRDAGVRVGHRDAAAHRAGADDGRAPDLGGRRVLRHVGNLRHLALGEEQMPQRLRLGRHARSRRTARARGSSPASNGSGQAGFDRVDDGERRRACRARSSSATCAHRRAGVETVARAASARESRCRASCASRRPRRAPSANAIAPAQQIAVDDAHR